MTPEQTVEHLRRRCAILYLALGESCDDPDITDTDYAIQIVEDTWSDEDIRGMQREACDEADSA